MKRLALIDRPRPRPWRDRPPLPNRARAPPASTLIDINSASRDDLMTLDGIGEVRADAIIRARPFKAKTELVERRLIPEALYDKIADKVMARPAARHDADADHPSAGRPSGANAAMDGRRHDLRAGHARCRRGRIPGAISVIRLSGPRATDALIFLTERRAFERGHSARDPALPEPRRMVRAQRCYDPLSGEAIDRGLVVWFEAPNSETGETMAELHLHGGRAVVGGALEAIRRLGFCRLAEPGEFTRRAFEHGKLDLTEAEAHRRPGGGRNRPAAPAGAAADGWRAAPLYEDWRTLGLAHAGASRSGDRFSRRGPAARHRRRGAGRHHAAAGRDRAPI